MKPSTEPAAARFYSERRNTLLHGELKCDIGVVYRSPQDATMFLLRD